MKKDQSLPTQQAGECRWKMKSNNQKFLLSCSHIRKNHEWSEALLPALRLWQRQYRCLLTYYDPRQKGSTERLIQFMWNQKWQKIFSQVRKPDLCVWLQGHYGFLFKDQIVWWTNFSPPYRTGWKKLIQSYRKLFQGTRTAVEKDKGITLIGVEQEQR